MEEDLEKLKRGLADQRIFNGDALSPSDDASVEGDGKAVFLEYGTEDEEEEFVRLEDRGWKGFYKKIFNK